MGVEQLHVYVAWALKMILFLNSLPNHLKSISNHWGLYLHSRTLRAPNSSMNCYFMLNEVCSIAKPLICGSRRKSYRNGGIPLTLSVFLLSALLLVHLLEGFLLTSLLTSKLAIYKCPVSFGDFRKNWITAISTFDCGILGVGFFFPLE